MADSEDTTGVPSLPVPREGRRPCDEDPPQLSGGPASPELRSIGTPAAHDECATPKARDEDASSDPNQPELTVDRPTPLIPDPLAPYRRATSQEMAATRRVRAPGEVVTSEVVPSTAPPSAAVEDSCVVPTCEPGPASERERLVRHELRFESTSPSVRTATLPWPPPVRTEVEAPTAIRSTVADATGDGGSPIAPGASTDWRAILAGTEAALEGARQADRAPGEQVPTLRMDLRSLVASRSLDPASSLLLAHVDGKRTAAEVAAETSLSVDAVNQALDALVRRGIVALR